MNEKHFRTSLDLTIHTILALILAWFLYWVSGELLWAILGIIGGILIDVDHFFDYFKYYGFRFSFKDFFGHKYLESGKTYTFLHSVELILVLWVLAVKFIWITPLALGMTIHILTDYAIHRRKTPECLFLIYRWRHKFNYNKLKPIR